MKRRWGCVVNHLDRGWNRELSSLEREKSQREKKLGERGMRVDEEMN